MSRAGIEPARPGRLCGLFSPRIFLLFVFVFVWRRNIGKICPVIQRVDHLVGQVDFPIFGSHLVGVIDVSARSVIWVPIIPSLWPRLVLAEFAQILNNLLCGCYGSSSVRVLGAGIEPARYLARAVGIEPTAIK